MELIKMRPEQVREAVKSQLPLFLPIGSYEYHGEHLPLGADTLIAEGICRRIAEKTNAIVAPPLYFTPTMSWAAGVEDGEMDFSPDALYAYVKEYLAKLMQIGFRKIYAMIGHQGKAGLPAITVQRAFLDANRDRAHTFGSGWGGLRQEQASDMVDDNFFSIVSLCDYDEFVDYAAAGRDERMPVGHGGRGETQLIMALYSGEGLAKTENLETTGFHIPDWLRDVNQASEEDGEFWVELCAEAWAKKITGDNKI